MASDHGPKWPKYPYCKTWRCVKHTRAIRKARWVRCHRDARAVGGSFYGDGHGAYHYNLDDGGVYFARLRSGGSYWWNRFQPGSKWTIIAGRKFVRAEVADWGTGGGPLFGLTRVVDMHRSLMEALGLHDNAVLGVTAHRCQ